MPDDSQSGVTFGDAIRAAYQLRDQIDEIEAVQKKQLEPYKGALEQWENLILKFLLESGQQKSAVEGVGTVYIRVQDSVSVKDWDEAWRFICEQQRFDMLEHKINKTTAVAYQEQTGMPVPGTNYTAVNKVGYNRARVKS